MAEYQDVIEDIRAFIAASDQSLTDDISAHAAEYVRLCREANRRLRVCVDALQRGQREDAIESANVAPNLLDFVGDLDLPEPDASRWRQICTMYGLPEAPRLLLEEATALNEAYSEALPLAELMSHHRLLALARAPLPERLSVMRQLATHDASTAYWEEDIRAGETARLEEIRISAATFARAGDAVGMNRLAQELQNTPWRVSVPAHLLQSIRQGALQTRAASALSELRQMVAQIDEAHAAMDLAQCEKLCDRWQKVIAHTGVAVPQEVQERVAPAFGWVTEQRQQRATAEAFSAACDHLQQQLDISAPQAEVEKSYLAASRIPLDLPPELEARYRKRLADHAAAVRMRRMLIGGAIAAAFAICAGIVIAVTYQSLRNKEVSEAMQVLQTAKADADAGDADTAERTVREISEQHPRAAASSVVAHEIVEVKSAIAMERDRQRNFAHVFAAAKDAGVEHPDVGDLQSAATLAKTDVEKAEVAELQSDIAQYGSSQQAQIDAKLASQGQALLDKINQTLTDDLLQHDPAEYRKQLDAFGEQNTALGNQAGASAQMRHLQTSAIQARLAEKQSALDRLASEQKMLASVTAFSGTAAAHEATLKEFIARCPDSPRVAAFTHELDQIPAEKAVEGWAQLVAPWANDPIPTHLSDATDRANSITAYLKNYPDSPIAPGAKAYLDYLQRGLAAAAPDGPIKKAWCDLLNNPLLHDLQMVHVGGNDPKVFYVLPAAGWQVKKEMLDGQVTAEEFDAIESSDIGKATHVRLTPPNILTGGTGLLDSETPTPAPQSDFAKDSLARAADLDFKGWEYFGQGALDSLAEKRNMDPVLRAILVENIIQMMQPTLDWAGDTGDKHVADKLAAQKVDDIDWLNPNAPPRVETIAGINGAIAGLTSTRDLEQLIRKQTAVACAALGLQVTGECVLIKNGDQLSLSPEPDSRSATAFIIGNGNTLTEIGRRVGDKWQFDASVPVGDGQLVFLGSLPRQ
jgi:hypothetical protein